MNKDFVTEANAFMGDFADNIIKQAKKEFADRIEELEKENAELKDVKERMEEIEKEHSKALLELEKAKERIAESSIIDLFKEVSQPVYIIKVTRKKLPKCNKCDNIRRIAYISKYGDVIYDDCSCNASYNYYVPTIKEVRWFRVFGWHFLCYFDDFYTTSIDIYRSKKNIDISPEHFDEFTCSKVMFTTEEKAQAFADYLNKKEQKKINEESN